MTKICKLARYKDIIPDFDGFMKAAQRKLPTTIRVNTLKTTTKEAKRRLREKGIEFQEFSWYAHGLRIKASIKALAYDYLVGNIHGQEEVSMIPPVVLEPKAGELVLDLCAAPGNKTTQISQIMQNRGFIVANDKSSGKVPALRWNCERLGVVNVGITTFDGRSFPLKVKFDKILVDAPCSCEGNVRKDWNVFEGVPLGAIKSLSRLQKGLMLRAVRLLKKGGTLVYSTCTFAPEENEEVVDFILSRFEGLRLEPVNVALKHEHGVEEWQGKKFSSEVQKCARFYPHLSDSGGFFVAKFKKVS
ncbi:NOL1/NOP2/sun family putative RNA methylase [Candidatus Alkanophaga liquidiphilum]